jgi:hypothetical protein
MIDPSNERDLDALLSGGRLSGPARDQIFDTVAAEVAGETRSRARRRVWRAAMAVAGAAAAILVVAPRLMTPDSEGLRAKGAQVGVAAQLDVACIGGTLASCPQGATLVFGASGVAATGVLSAYAEPMGRDVERIWYFSAEGESPRLTVGGATDVARRAVRIGSEHAPGRYRLHVFLTRGPATQAMLLAGNPPDAIVGRELVLQVVPSR